MTAPELATLAVVIVVLSILFLVMAKWGQKS
jgi:hypothetical protein